MPARTTFDDNYFERTHANFWPPTQWERTKVFVIYPGSQDSGEQFWNSAQERPQVVIAPSGGDPAKTKDCEFFD